MILRGPELVLSHRKQTHPQPSVASSQRPQQVSGVMRHLSHLSLWASHAHPLCRQLYAQAKPLGPFHSHTLYTPTGLHCCVCLLGLHPEPSHPASRPCCLLLIQDFFSLPSRTTERPIYQSSFPGLPSDLSVFMAPQTQEAYPSPCSLIPCQLC